MTLCGCELHDSIQRMDRIHSSRSLGPGSLKVVMMMNLVMLQEWPLQPLIVTSKH